jgi:hypothetical protein
LFFGDKEEVEEDVVFAVAQAWVERNENAFFF